MWWWTKMAFPLITCLLAYLVQNTLLAQVSFLSGINLYLLVLVVLGYFPSKLKVPYLGLVLGFFCDLAYLNHFGFYMGIYFVLGLFLQVLLGYLNSNSLVSAMIAGALGIFIFNLLTGVLGQILGMGLSTEFILSTTMSGTIFVHGLLAGLLFILMKKVRGKNHAPILD